jgi:F-type H+-transporting ATPase subunit b
MNFLKGQRYDLAREIDELNEQKSAAEARLKEIQKNLDDSNARFQAISERIIRQGERRQAEIIEDARRESKILLESARQKVNTRFLRARELLRAELVDTAIDAVLERLPQEVSEADSQRMVDDFMNKALAG